MSDPTALPVPDAAAKYDETLPPPWVDDTIYSRLDTERVPKVWVAWFGRVRLVVARKSQLAPWVAKCWFFEETPLRHGAIRNAAAEAKQLLRDQLTRALAELNENP